MVILKWLTSILVGNHSEVTRAAAGQADREKRLKEKKSGSVDLVNAALVDHAENLDDLLSSGSQGIERKKMKRRVKEKVERVIAKEFNDPEIIEEVTEKIANAAEIDPFYRHLFSPESDEK